jgi:hypothetical protein
MRASPPAHVLRRLSAAIFLFAAAGSLGCGSSTADGDDEDESGGGGSGGTTGTAGSGGTSGTGGSGGSGGVPPYCMTEFGPTDPTALIDDIEDGNPLIAMVQTRNGSWWVTTDGTAGTIAPPNDAAPPPERILGGRCDSEFGMRLTGQGFTQWGANISIGFRYVSDQEPIDASAFSGVMFWARVGETHNSPVRVGIQDSNTHPNGGVCDPMPDSAEQCYDGFGTQVLPISTEWRLYKLDFSRMTQQGFGHQAEALDTTALYGMEWTVMQGTVFDLWLDDLWFYE